MSNEIDVSGLSPEAAALVRQYEGKNLTQSPEQFQLSGNGHQRIQEDFQRRGMTREQAQADAGMNKTALLKALAEQARNRGGAEHAMGINGRSGASRAPERVGKSLAEMARTPAAPKSE